MDEEKKTVGSSASKAERARERRKENIEEAAKKEAEKEARASEGKHKNKKLIKILTTAGVLCLALLIFLLSFFGVFERTSSAIKYKDGTKVSAAEYEYFYRMYYNYYANMSQQYDSQYGMYFGEGAGKMMTGFDYTKTPADQPFTPPQGSNETVDEKYGKDPTWADYFEMKAIQDAEAAAKFYPKAVDAGYKMSKADQEELDKFLEELNDSAEQNGYSLDAYLRQNYGRGMTKNLLQKIYTQQKDVEKYLTDVQKKFADGITDKEIADEYKNNTKEYIQRNIRFYQFAADTKNVDKLTKEQKDKRNAELKKKADAFLSGATNENFSQMASDQVSKDEKTAYLNDASYTTLSDLDYASAITQLNKEAAEWAFAKSRKPGDKTVITKDEDNGLKTYLVLLYASEGSRDESHPVAVRQILFQVGEDNHTDAEAKALAEKTLKEWQDGKATDASFAALAEKKTEDTGSKDNGGLYEDITPDSQYVSEFLNWCFASGRKAGDTGIIKTEYGYHVMYCQSVSKYPVWQDNIRKALAQKKYDAFYEKTLDADNAKVSKHWTKTVRNRVQKTAETLIGNLNSQSSDSAASFAMSGDDE